MFSWLNKPLYDSKKFQVSTIFVCITKNKNEIPGV